MITKDQKEKPREHRAAVNENSILNPNWIKEDFSKQNVLRLRCLIKYHRVVVQ